MKRFPKSLLYLALSLFFLLSLSLATVESLQKTAVGFASPLLSLFTSGDELKENETLQMLRLENSLLKNELEEAIETARREIALKNYVLEIAEKGFLSAEAVQKLDLHSKKVLQDLERRIEAVTAKVIFRSPNSWNSTLWINEGESGTIKKNSPVVVGDTLVGIVETAGKSQSRVRLITDAKLTPSVRALRKIVKEDGSIEEIKLAKGELQGSGIAAWRRFGNRLRGVGFNYDFADKEGSARDLRTGEPIEEEGKPLPIIKVGDILVTTGMDGVFPEGLKVAKVKKIQPLREGDFSYSIEAVPLVKEMDALSRVFVLPPHNR